MKVLITGNEGFIGKNIEIYLKNKGFEVIGFDKADGKDLFYKEEGWNQLYEVMETHKPSYVVHCAAALNNDVFDCLRNNISASINLFNVCKDFKVKKLINFFSAAIYGELNSIANEYSAKYPINIYGWSKLCVENLTYQYFGKIPFLNFRLANVYGKGGKGIINQIIEKGIKGDTIKLNNQGLNIRDFVYVEDICKITEMCLHNDLLGTYNISTKIPTLISLLPKKIEQTFNIKIKYENTNPIDEIKYSCLDNYRITNALNFQFTYLEEGLKLLKQSIV